MHKRRRELERSEQGEKKKRRRGRKKRDADTAGYSLVDKRNDAFEKFYKEQNIVSEDEWSAFMSALRENLPATFRITGTRSHAKQVSECLETIFFKDMHGLKVDGEIVSPPHPLSWYPDRLAWHVSLPRKVLRKHPTLAKFHQFLVHETEKGNLSRQEAVSMIPPLLLDVKPHHKILDMCAAPGSKTAQLLELLHAEDTATSTMPSGFVIANDKDHKRCYILLHQTKRINSPCLMVTNHDASVYPTIYLEPKAETASAGRQPLVYDRVLCDVPCSGDGTIRKNIIMWKKWNPTLGPGLHRVQLRILCRGIEVLASGGRLVYSTCSLNPIEDEAVVAALLAMSKGTVELVDVSNDIPGLKTCPGVYQWRLLSKRGEWFDSHEQVPEALSQGLCATMFPPSADEARQMHLERCQRILPHHQDTGGFFVAVLQKLASVPWQRKFPTVQVAVHQIEATGGGSSEAKGGENGDSCDKDIASITSADVRKPDTVCESHDILLPSSEIVSETNEMDDTANSVSEDTKAYPALSDDAKASGNPKDVVGKDFAEGVEKKEEPFIFLTQDDPDWLNLREYYGLESLPVDLLLVRSHTPKKRKVYIVSRAVKGLVLNQKQHVRIVNLGVRVFQRSEGRDVNCPLRLVSEGLAAILPYMQKRRIYVTLPDMEIMLREFSPSLTLLSPSARAQLSSLVTGSVVFTYDPFREDASAESSSAVAPTAGPQCAVDICGWAGGSSVRMMSNDADRMHYLLILGMATREDIKVESKPRRTVGQSAHSLETGLECDKELHNASDNDGDGEVPALETDSQAVDGDTSIAEKDCNEDKDMTFSQ